MQNCGMVFNVQKFSIHDGPGIRTTVFLKGCPLRCAWCANPESQSSALETGLDGSVYGASRTVSDVMDEVRQDLPFYLESGGGVTLSGGEPLMQGDFACALLRALKAEGIHTAVETTGEAEPAAFARALAFIDLFLFDVKHYDGEKHRLGTGLDNRRILDNLRTVLASGKDLLVRIPVIPGFNDRCADAEGFCALFAQLGVQQVELLPFHQFGEKKYALLGRNYALQGCPALRDQDLEAYREVFSRNGLHCK
ncbi:MAG: glycyl-radical enzyme activating protein [Clostridia bacterium]